MKSSFLFTIPAFLLMAGCINRTSDSNSDSGPKPETVIESGMKITKRTFGTTGDGLSVNSFTLDNGVGMEVEIIEFGAIVKTIRVPDKDGNIADVVLGYDDLKGYQNDAYYFGGTIGRVANRMGGAEFELNGRTYELAPNTLPDFGKNHLHGGVKGFNKVLWKGEMYSNESEVGVKLNYVSKDGDEGYPGNLNCTVVYSLNMDNELGISFTATTDQSTLVNMTHHSYFNLAGAGAGTILDHMVQINAELYTPADNDLIPTGEVVPVSGLPVDFREEATVGSRIDEMQSVKFRGFDLNYVIDIEGNGKMKYAAKAYDSDSGRLIEVYTTQPCMHFYTSNFLSGESGKGGVSYNRYGALCFEPQGFPDAPHHENFLPVKLEPGETYDQKIIYKFSSDRGNL